MPPSTIHSQSDASRWIDMAAVMAVKNLQWRAKTIVNGLHKGIHRSSKHGFSVEFSEYRPFSAGDDLRSVDWKLFARSDRLFIKKYEDETNRRCLLVLDQSRSMQFGTTGYTKSDYAKTLAASLAYYWIEQRDAVGAITFDEGIGEIVPSRYRPGQLKRVLSTLDRPATGKATNLVTPLEQIADWSHRRSLIAIISDFLIPSDVVRQTLSRLTARKHELVLLQILDPGELQWTHKEPKMVLDMESGKEIFVDPASAAEKYQSRFQAHQEAWKTMANQLGIRWIASSTQAAIDRVLLDLVQNYS